MRAEFLHVADVHLGYQQYGHPERFNDFAKAYLAAVDYAVGHHVDLVLVCGDLFHKSAVDPPTLLQAVEGLDRLREAAAKDFIVVLEVDGDIVGTGTLEEEYITRVFVNPQFQGQGWGKAIMNELEAIAEERGMNMVKKGSLTGR